MSTLKISGCMSVVKDMGDLDRDALLERLDQYRADGVPVERAQVMATADTMAELEDERREFMRLLKEQHPDIFAVTASAEREGGTRKSTDREYVDTPSFRRWFADSVMTEDGKPGGEPLVLYHGGFDFAQAPDGKAVPKVNGRGALGVGFYMTPDEERARGYAEDNSGAVSSLYVRMERPLEIRLSRGQDPMVEALVALGMDRDKAARKVESAYEKYGYVGSEVKNLALNQGYDGLVEYVGNKMSEVVVWNPTQVKSATNNDGGFSWSPDIRRSADRTPLGFYSALARGLQDAPIKSAPAGAWKAAIKGLLNKGAVKADEVEWSGINDWLDLEGQPKPVYESGYGLIDEHQNEDGTWQQVDDLGAYFRTKDEAESAITDELRRASEEWAKKEGVKSRISVESFDNLDFGKTVTPKITKEQVAQYLEQGGVKVEEVILTGDAEAKRRRTQVEERGEEIGDKFWPRVYEKYGEPFTPLNRENKELIDQINDGKLSIDKIDPSLRDLYSEYLDYIKEFDSLSDIKGDAKYGQYTLPGGENYREVLLTLPGGESLGDAAKRRDAAWRKIEALPDYPAGLHPMAQPRWAEENAPDLYAEWQDASRAANKKDTGSNAGAYRSNHWDQPNVLVHIRVNDRTDADGNRVLFVEELQSDWGQEGKKKGFAGAGLEVRKIVIPNPLKGLGGNTKAEATRYAVFDGSGKKVSADFHGEKAAQDALASMSVPTAPFVTKTEGWLNLALKRIMVMAAEGGYDKVAFVNGEQSADRYDLSKQIERVTAYKETGGTYRISATDINGNTLPAQRAKDATELEGIVGKELAQKIVDQKGVVESYSGLDLKVGGEGMKTFYNTIVPTALKKLLPKVGGGQMGEVRIDQGGNRAKVGDPDEAWPFAVWRRGRIINRHAIRAYAEEEVAEFREIDERAGERDPTLRVEQVLDTTSRQPGFDVTDAMREKVAGGVPLFSPDRAQTETPEFKKWFGDSKVVNADGKPLIVYRGQRRVAKPDKFIMTRSRENPSFAADPVVASVYSRQLETQQYGAGSNVMPVYLSIKKPLDIRNLGEQVSLEDIVSRLNWDWSVSSGLGDYEKSLGYGDLADALRSMDFLAERTGARFDIDASDEEGFRIDSFEDLANYIQNRGDENDPESIDLALMDAKFDAYMIGDSADWTYLLSELGFDGVFHKDVFDVGARYYEGDKSKLEEGYEGGPVHDTYRPFEQAQIKSAIGNNGDFAADNPDITKSADRVQASEKRDTDSAERFDPKQIENKRVPDYKSREKLIDMPIDDFLALAEKGEEEGKGRDVKKLLDNNTRFSSLPYLNVDSDYRVDGHEGRHRARALKAAGYEKMPVILRMAGLRWSEQTDPSRFDYVKDWPTELQAEVTAENPYFSIPFPVSREGAMRPYRGDIRASEKRDTDSAEFKRWFGDSKVVDEKGEPLVVYHGTHASDPIERFSEDKIGSRTDDGFMGRGFYFGDSTDASSYAGYHPFSDPSRKPSGGSVYPVYLSLQNPLVLFGRRVGERVKRMPDRGVLARDAAGLPRSASAAELRAKLEGMGHDGVIYTDELGTQEYVAFRPEQIKSATDNNGQFDPTSPDITKSADRPWFDDLSELKISTNYRLGDLLKTSKKLNWWDRSVGTQYNIAQKHPQFKRVFDAVQRFINDVSAYATRAADLAPSILPKLETLKDIARSPLSAEDVKALRDPIFGGTLKYTRDDEGNVIETDDVSTAGVVFTNDELRELFGLSDRQVKLYREFRRATNRSLTDLAVSDMLRYLGTDGAGVRQRALEATNLDGALDAMVAHLDQLIEQQPQRAKVLEDSKRAIKEKAGQAIGLMARGYAPLSRFGQFTVYAVSKDGEQLYFSMFENERDANKMAREMREQYPDATVTTGTMSQESYKLFSGVTPETLALFGESLGLEESGVDAKSEVFQAYLKMAKTNRSAMKRLIQRKGIDGFSEDAGRVLAGFVYSNARQISTNLHAGEISRSAAAVTDGDVKDAAIRLVEYIQNPQEEAQALRGLLFTQFIGGSIASALVNMTQPFTMTLPYLTQFDGAVGASKRMADAVKLVSRGIRNDDDLQAALKRGEELGIVSPQEVHQLMAQAQGRGSLQSGDGTKAGDAAAKVNNSMAKLGLVWGKLFSAAEQFNRRVTFIAAYKLARDQGMPDPMAFAEQAIAETQGVYNKGNKPKWARGAVGGTLFTFKQYSIAYVEFLRRMATSGEPGSAERRAGQKAVGLALGVLFLTAGMSGLPGADDLDDVIDGFMQRVLGRSFDSKQAKKEFFASLLGQSGAEFVMSGLSGLPGVPIDISGRMGLGNLIPGTGIFTKKRDYGRDFLEVVGPAGTLFANAGTALASLAQGEVKKAAEVLAPVAAQNALKAVDMAQMGYYRDMKGRKVVDTDGWDALAKSIGFQPRAVAQVQGATMTQANLVGQNKLRETEIADKWARGRIERKPDLIQEAKDELADWNRKNPESKIRIDEAQINKRVQEANKTKAQRIAATAPKEIRDAVKKQLESEGAQ